MINFVWDAYQQGQIADAKAEATQAKHDVGRQTDRLRELEFSHQRMALISQALWELLSSRFELTEAELIAKIHEIDARDGKQDGRMSVQAIACPSCQRTVNTKHLRCIYCGATVPKPHVFQA